MSAAYDVASSAVDIFVCVGVDCAVEGDREEAALRARVDVANS